MHSHIGRYFNYFSSLGEIMNEISIKIIKEVLSQTHATISFPLFHLGAE